MRGKRFERTLEDALTRGFSGPFLLETSLRTIFFKRSLESTAG